MTPPAFRLIFAGEDRACVEWSDDLRTYRLWIDAHGQPVGDSIFSCTIRPQKAGRRFRRMVCDRRRATWAPIVAAILAAIDRDDLAVKMAESRAALEELGDLL